MRALFSHCAPFFSRSQFFSTQRVTYRGKCICLLIACCRCFNWCPERKGRSGGFRWSTKTSTSKTKAAKSGTACGFCFLFFGLRLATSKRERWCCARSKHASYFDERKEGKRRGEREKMREKREGKKATRLDYMREHMCTHGTQFTAQYHCPIRFTHIVGRPSGEPVGTYPVPCESIN